MINNLTFSFGIPAFKGKHLQECISSIINQTYIHFELIIINDQSPDPIKQIVNKFQDKRILYFENDQNIGAENVVSNWNNCLYKSSNTFFILMGDDDKLEPDYLEQFVNLINKFPNLDIYHCRSAIIDENGKMLLLTPSSPEYETIYENIWHCINEYRIPYISDFVYRSNHLKTSGGFHHFPLAWGSDNISSYIAIGIKGIAHINKPLLNYRSHAMTISSSGKYELKMKAILLQQEWLNKFLETKPSSYYDIIIYNDLCKTVHKYIQKKKIYTLAYSMETNYLNFIKSLLMRKTFKLSLLEICYSIVIHLKEKLNKSS